MNLLTEAKNLQPKLIEYRRHFHMNPELSGQEFQTAATCAKALQELGLEVQTAIGSPLPGVVALLRGVNAGKTVALRADMDALGLIEQNDITYRSKIPKIMHACGHDAHMAILLGAAELLSKNRHLLQGNVKFIFQPSEEIYGGALPMIEAGVLEDPTVDAIFGLHMDTSFPTGEIGISYGETMASSDRIIFKVKGKSAHGASPHESIDAIVIASHIIVALQSLISREKDPFNPAVLSFGIMHGGNQPNVICEEVLVRGILRTLNPETRELLNTRIESLVQGISASFGASCDYTRERSYDCLINNNLMVDFLKATAAPILGKDNIKQLHRPRMIVEDFAYYLQRVPGAFWYLGCGDKSRGIDQPLHSSTFDIDEDSLSIGAAIQASLALDFLNR